MSVYIAPFTFDFDAELIYVDSGFVDVDCLDLYDAIKEAQSSEEGIIYERAGSATGLEALGGAVQVGITVKLLGSWQVQFPAGNYVARVAGGNLIGGPGGDPIAYSAGVQTLLIQSAASTVVTTGGSALTPAESAHLMGLDTQDVNVETMNGAQVIGTGTTGDAWRGVGVSP